VALYLYNDEGQRTRKSVFNPDGSVQVTTIFHYDHSGYLITETTESGDLIRDYIWLEGMTPVAQIDDTAGFETVAYLHTDHLMTNRLATDEVQQVVWRWEGEAFGNTEAQGLGATTVNLRFPGQYFDVESNLHYNMHRYYDPILGRYITADPIGLSGGLNTYGYVGGHPTIYVDSTGLETTIYIGGNNWYDHAATNINATVYSTGRYPVPGIDPTKSGLAGPNVLVVRGESGYLAAHPTTTAYTLDLSSEQEAKLSQYYQDLISQSTRHPARSNWYVLPDDYSFLGNNCASTVVDGLQSALPWYQSMSLPGVATPQTLQLNLEMSPFLVK
jgi:RHS repeat-associated protein